MQRRSERGEGVEGDDLWEGKGRRTEPSRGHSAPSKGGEDLNATTNMFRKNGHLIRWHIERTETAPKYRKCLMTVVTVRYLRRLGTGKGGIRSTFRITTYAP